MLARGGDYGGRGLGPTFLPGAPGGRGQGVQLSGRRCGQPVDDIGQVGLGIESSAAGADHDGIEDGAVFAGIAGAEKERVLFAPGAGADFVFGEVVVDLDAAGAQIGAHAAEGVACVVEGFAKSAFRKMPAAGLEEVEGFFENPQDGTGPGGARRLPQDGAVPALAEGFPHWARMGLR